MLSCSDSQRFLRLCNIPFEGPPSQFQAARTVVRNFWTSVFSRALSLDSICAKASS